MWLPELLLIAFLPGALLYRVPSWDRDRRAGLSAEERGFWAVVVSTAWTSLVVLVLGALSRYTLPHLMLANALLCVIVLAAWRRRLLYVGTAPAPRWSALFPLSLLVLGLVLFFPPAEFVISGKDPGVYVSEGIALARCGSLVIHDRLVAAVPPVLRDLFFPPYRQASYFSIRFMGFFLVDPMKGTVSAQFPHLYPAWIAIGYGLGGLRSALLVTGAWATFGLVAVYFVGARLLGRAPAWCAAALLALCVIEGWFGRYPNSEVVLQALLFAGLLGFARAHLDGDRFFAPVAGVLLGLLVFARFDAILAWAGIGLAVVCLALRGRRPRASFLAAGGLALVAVAAYAVTVMAPGFSRYSGFVQNLRMVHLALLAAGVAGALALLVMSRVRRLADRSARGIPAVLSLLVVGAAVYAYYFRQPGGRLAAHDALSLRAFVWYVPWAGLVAALAGFALLCWKRFWRDPGLLLVTAVYAFFVFYKIQIVPEHFWMTRRFLPVILPATFLLISAAAFYGVWSPDQERRPRGWSLRSVLAWALPSAFVAIIGVLLVQAARPVWAHQEYQGLIQQVEKLAGRFGDRDLVLVESRRSSDLHVVALPLAYVFDRQVLLLASPRPDRLLFRNFLDWARSRYTNVYFVGSGGTDLLSRSVAVIPVSTERFQVPEYESPWNSYPREVRQKEFDFSVYKFVDAPEEPEPLDLRVGTNDDLYVVRFHAKERLHDYSYRWTTDSSYVTLVGLTARSSTIRLTMDAGGRPAAAGPAVVTCSIGDRLIGQVTVAANRPEPYEFPIPPDLAAAADGREEPMLLRIVSSVWSPKRLTGEGDSRTLGVMLLRVTIE
jgi:hypothetical protein